MRMREIKFRAWYGEKIGMLTPTFNGDINEIFAEQTGVYMQYTGLKDKNGREIFEGDILRVWREDEYIPNRDDGGGIVDYDCEYGFSQVGKVGFTGGSFDYSTVKTLSGMHEEIHAPIDWLVNFEVIGNVYENSDLLK